MWVLIFIAVITVIVLIVDAIKKKLNRSVVSADRYQRQQEFTNQEMLIETSASFKTVFAEISNVFPQQATFSENFKGGLFRLTSRYQNKLTYEHTASVTAFSGGDNFTSSIRFYEKPNGMVAIVSIERWRVSSGVAYSRGIDAMEEFYRKVETAFKNADSQASIKFSGVGCSFEASNLNPINIM